jgi:hypothetical protein
VKLIINLFYDLEHSVLLSVNAFKYSSDKIKKWKDKFFSLDLKTRGIIIGELLSDGYIQQRGHSMNFQIYHSHSNKNNLEYFYHLFYYFQKINFCSSNVPTPKSSKIRGQEFFAMHKNLYSSEIWYYLHNLFYRPITDFDRLNFKLPHNQKWIKTVPVNIDQFMSLTTFAPMRSIGRLTRCRAPAPPGEAARGEPRLAGSPCVSRVYNLWGWYIYGSWYFN